jgi:formylglycine-generating enzyme required for sulfatase activity
MRSASCHPHGNRHINTTAACRNTGPNHIHAPANRDAHSHPTLGIGSTIIGRDGAVLVYVPAGEFLMGSTYADTFAQEDEIPQRTIYLDAYWIDQTEVTNG